MNERKKVRQMLTYEEAKKVGTKACLEKLGRDFVIEHRKTACSAYGDEDDHAFCFVGVDTEPDTPWTGGEIVFDDSPDQKFPFSASCNVSYADGVVTFLDCRLPAMA